ncbi:hypothetical protein A3742_12810 [Oleiphilus sp. HI0071]|jgi:acyl-CoA thioesterase YciA|uniref:acyl-CoA thioesterase n=1 Tax=unclassified Oleiphilus TaxID=2631174 RepID=UPI0007C39AAF|nr:MULTISPECIES: hotdog domain-containing protein [unclassified Oleiphilus]KZY68018.1 hypothetical protein A3737_01470 [Oleiphilus sp. HI0065]KZY79953.1 hypothetical protein A3742_21160 [Oleiphilus sp. HI0071]KZY93080.1 hypothetical protein A3744_14240 [Oleiphilus sp. HI0073]KZZ47103.1 hypothetical protein A3758_17655 [Oleiphilus sp. HI0118]KZZ51604.1 hypothetical protein A3760_12060 [Oleiphilus sp. HI0122]KZZ74265.1 hypothetical protein A3765_11685 [Oleiphilus sp. HI0130]KZZ74675.1 hypothet
MTLFEGLRPSPDSELMLKVSATGASTNVHGDVYAGWLLDQMDTAATLCATKLSKGRCSTVAVENIQFQSPINVGDLVSFYARLEDSGRSSMVVVVEVFAEQSTSNVNAKVTEGRFTLVAIDQQGAIRQIL